MTETPNQQTPHPNELWAAAYNVFDVARSRIEAVVQDPHVAAIHAMTQLIDAADPETLARAARLLDADAAELEAAAHRRSRRGRRLAIIRRVSH